MVDEKHGKSKREHKDVTEARTTALEPKSTGAGTPSIRVFGPPDLSPSPDTGTPLPDDPSVLKENVKGLKSQLRRHKRQVLLNRPSAAHEIYGAIVGG